MTRLRNLFMTVLFAAGSFLILSVETGCANSNAVKAARNNQTRVSFDEVDTAANELAAAIKSSAKFQTFQRDAIGRGEAVVILLNQLDVAKNSGLQSARDLNMTNELFNSLEESFVNSGVGEFTQMVDKNAPNYIPGMEAFDEQDFDDRFDQSTGTVTTGGAAKAVLGMQITMNRSDMSAGSGGRSDYTWIMRVKIIDGVRKTTVYSGKQVLYKDYDGSVRSR
jgi:hypothetical protein